MSELFFETSTDSAQVERIYRVIRPGSDTRRFHWLCERNPAGPALHFLARLEPDSPAIGCVTVIPLRLVLHGRRALLGQIVDGMVLAEHRRGGVFGRLLGYAMAEARRHVEGVIGFPNELSLGPSLRVGFAVLGDLSTFVLPLGGGFLSRRLLGPSREGPRAWAARACDPMIGAYLAVRAGGAKAQTRPVGPDELLAPFADPSQPVFTPRDPDFARWRFFDVPSEEYETLRLESEEGTRGHAAWRVSDGDAELIDLDVHGSDAARRSLVRGVVDHCRRRGLDSLQMQCSPANDYVPTLRALGFLERKAVSSVILLPFSEEIGKVRFADWRITRADSDWI